MLQLLSSFQGRALLAALPQEDTGNLDDTNASEEEVDGGKPGIKSVEYISHGANPTTYRMLRGLMIKHQRVQMAPVAIKAAFWVRDSFSAGRLKSEIPAMTRAHYSGKLISNNIPEAPKPSYVPLPVACHEGSAVYIGSGLSVGTSPNRTFITGALSRQEHQHESSEMDIELVSRRQ